MTAASNIALSSTCLKAFCGAVLVSGDEIIGRGFNSPAGGEPNRCSHEYVIPENNKNDITCCSHAEVRAIHDALAHHPDKVVGSTLYFMRLDKNKQQTKAGVPYCTLCSKEALDSGVKEFVLWHESGITVYDTQEYNNVSYQYFKDPSLWPLK
ncbi:MAG: hypothetical protein M3Q64_00825 [bacterium]|nr:hypothetical protein [bacterium]